MIQQTSLLWAKMATKWWKNLPAHTKAHYKRTSSLRDTQSICRYWLNVIATPHEVAQITADTQRRLKDSAS